MPPIRIPKTPAAAFDPSRPASALLKSQVKQLQLVVFEAMTEGEAAKHIKALTRQLHARHPHTAPRRHGAHRPPAGAKNATRAKTTKRTKRTR
jgi:hypothetical protein